MLHYLLPMYCTSTYLHRAETLWQARGRIEYDRYLLKLCNSLHIPYRIDVQWHYRNVWCDSLTLPRGTWIEAVQVDNGVFREWLLQRSIIGALIRRCFVPVSATQDKRHRKSSVDACAEKTERVDIKRVFCILVEDQAKSVGR